ncbi:hypothetical protein D9613_008728 [Agrocybe pediades]|uniref:Uncharacterized protein n=1 Tax=Agrocybe pediades TaxID=84607 RepID=A0A8H4QV77_9AGAR|nr:hypothetical protein D9613_008728 [Agrocybe pediades]
MLQFCTISHRPALASLLRPRAQEANSPMAWYHRYRPGTRTQYFDMCPRTRLEIIWTCLATILAASWVSIHPNMPGPNVSKVKKTLQRIETMLWAVIMPELVILWAIGQWRGAKEMENVFTSRYRKLNDGFKWTKKHGFFLQMGGFVLYEKDKPKRILEWKALIKADAFGKCIALIQTSWFIIQCIARFSDKQLALTELELVTAALSILNLLMYCFWWNKPFNAEVPIVIVLLNPIRETRSHRKTLIDPDDILPIHTTAVSKFGAFILARIEFVRSNLLTWDHLQKLALIPYNVGKYVPGCIDKLLDTHPQQIDPYSMKVPAFYYSRVVTSVDSPTVLNEIGSFFVAALFGAIHCAGWSDKMTFHTHTVSLLWRISSVIITGFPLLWISVFISLHIDDAILGGQVLANVNEALMIVLGYLSLFSIPFYIIARTILLILAFMELRYVPQGALNNIPWANVLPFIH